MIGETIAHYRVTAKIGEGGMGEVYRTTDTKLHRDVAIKVLPQSFAQDAECMARVTREAHVLASLNHPNIAAIYGLEENTLVMELVEGEPLRGPVTLEEIAAAGASKIIQESDFGHLKLLLGRLSTAIKSNACYEASQAHLHFHRYIWNISSNKILARTLDQVVTPLFAFTSILRSKGVHDLKRVVHSHVPIVAALRCGDLVEIREVLEGHFQDSYDPFLNSGFVDCHSLAESLKVKQKTSRKKA
jgi:serine/threonine protein kinase